MVNSVKQFYWHPVLHHMSCSFVNQVLSCLYFQLHFIADQFGSNCKSKLFYKTLAYLRWRPKMKQVVLCGPVNESLWQHMWTSSNCSSFRVSEMIFESSRVVQNTFQNSSKAYCLVFQNSALQLSFWVSSPTHMNAVKPPDFQFASFRKLLHV
jgi:hypothetical protein